MKQIYLYSWAAKNLGDDLFLKIIADRYKNKFTCVSSVKYANFSKNIKFINNNNLLIRIYRKTLRMFFKKEYNLKETIRDKSDMMICLGGSLFIESKDKIRNEQYLSFFKEYDNPKYFLGCNIGPYINDSYINKLREYVFNNANDICFRDYKSYSLYNEDNSRYAQDIVFNLNIENYKVPTEKKVIISVIECTEKQSQIGLDCKKDYENKIVEIILYYIKKGYIVELMSFCKLEKDEEAIKSIKQKLPINIKDKVKSYYYKGNINSALKEIASSEIIIGTRFHANILGIIFNKKILPIAYNNKTNNTLTDLDFKGEIIDIKRIKDFDIKLLEKIKEQNIKIEKIKKDAEKHFLELDKILIKK